MGHYLSATIDQLAWYLERDGATAKSDADGNQTITVPLMGGSATYMVPAHMVGDLNAARDRAYRALADRRRKAAAR